MFRNGIFDFNITRLVAFIETHADRFPIEVVAVASTPNYGDSRLDLRILITWSAKASSRRLLAAAPAGPQTFAASRSIC